MQGGRPRLPAVSRSADGGQDRLVVATAVLFEAELVQDDLDHLDLSAKPCVGFDPAHELNQFLLAVLVERALAVTVLLPAVARADMGLGLDVRTGSSGDRPGLGRRRLGGAGVRSVGRRGPARGSLSEIIGVLDGLPVGRDDSADFSVAVSEPLGRPDAVEAPAESLELLLAEPVAVAGGWRGVVGGAVAFDRQDELARSGRVRWTAKSIQ